MSDHLNMPFMYKVTHRVTEGERLAPQFFIYLTDRTTERAHIRIKFLFFYHLGDRRESETERQRACPVNVEPDSQTTTTRITLKNKWVT